ncbi:MAG: hypothetical protein H0V29_13000 [Thermoleophilaceae bacterium]|nr:hypothetical protein [Thermoleophilaceae bacterium]
MVDSRVVSLTVPADADYLVLARLALSAVCRLTRLRPEDVSDLKLALTEAAGGMVAGGGEVRFTFEVGDDSLAVVIRGDGADMQPVEDDELARAIVAATVDDCVYENGQVRLVKYLAAPDE